MMQLSIPRFEPEVISSATKRRCGDIEKVPTTSIGRFSYHGVTVSSRYGKVEEHEAMTAMIDAVSSNLRNHINSIFCDSNAGACYLVTLESYDSNMAYEVGKQMEAACLVNGGHNGITLTGADDSEVHISPNWNDD